MKTTESKSISKYLVISGYTLLVIIMMAGLWTIFKNLVVFSEKRIQDENRRELIIVGNVINRLYEAESTYNLMTYGSTNDYIKLYNEIKPEIILKLDTLKQLSKDTARIVKLDSIEVLLSEKESNLRAISILMDSVQKAPRITRETVSAFVPKKLNSDIRDYLKEKELAPKDLTENGVDTTVIKGEKKGLLRRLGDAFAGKQDSTVIVQNRQATIVQKEFELVVDTIVNMVRYSERLNLENQKKFQTALIQRQANMNQTNHMLTLKIDDLLKTIENEEIEKQIQLINDKDITLAKSYKTVFGVSLIAVAIALLFGILFVVDINRSQRYKRRLEESNQKINQLLKSREKLMLSVSHDIKAPMSSILGYIELVESNFSENCRKDYLENMKKSGDHILQLVTSLLDFQKIESGTWQRKEINFNLFELIENSADSFKPIASKKQLTFNININVPKDLSVYGDPFMIREIFSNLISNAIKYTPKGKVQIFANLDPQKNLLKFLVKDTGVGIEKEYQDFIFQEFTQIKPENIENFSKGSGLGLAITKGLVEQLKGTIGVKSEKGVGSEFFVDLPLQKNKAIQPDISDQNDNQNNINFENLSILVIDDDTIQLTMVSEMLKTRKINVVIESNPNKTIDLLKAKKFDLIFLDLQMPEINGFVLVKQILNSGLIQGKMTPIIALSAKSDITMDDFRSSGFSDFLNKPFTSQELFNMIGKHMRVNILNEVKYVEKAKGVKALIDIVKEDKVSSAEILKAFIKDNEVFSQELKNALKTGDHTKIALLAHKMLPLVKMMGDEKLTSVLLMLDKSKMISKEEIEQTILRIEGYIQKSEATIIEIEKS